MSFENAFKIVCELVDNFKQNEIYYLSQSYQEADVRNDFINKFFIALGWDVRHETQKNPYEQEVRVEKPLQIAKAQKRADYSFSLAPDFRTVKFFVEAKKPTHDLLNKDYYFQTARYGWNASTPVAVLTDFEEFHIVDCRFRPNIDDALNYKLKQFHYSDYTDKEKFSEIYWLFSREAITDGSIEKYADALPKPRGKKAKITKTILQSIDEAFLTELDEIRNDLAKSFKKNNEHLSSEELTEATQRTIDRLVFIKFLEDKLIEPDHYVSNFGGRKSAWEDFLLDSRKLDAKYNGVVFKKSLIDTRNVIEPDDKTFSAICDELSHENTPYNFDAIPIHILGSIYERFLGKVVHATDKRATIEEKPEVRKAGGVYYTPQYIVNYIVENTVGKLIAGKTPRQIKKMRFADIACGSGSFLITVFETLLDYHKQYYQQNPEQAKKDGCILYEGAYRLSLKQKQTILTNNIYGVDIDQQAVEVTQLSLYLKLLEDETTATANDTWVLFKEQLLPDLNKNIVCGNSLIGTDILAQQSSLPLGGTEGGVNELKIKPMDFENVFPEVMKVGGFDAVVGNPPYYGRATTFDNILKRYIDKSYVSSQGKYELYQLFIERSLSLIKAKGLLSYITPQTWLSIMQADHLRRYILNNHHIVSIVYSRIKIFRASIDNIIFIISNQVSDAETLVYEYKSFFNEDIRNSVNTLKKEDIIKNEFIIDAYKQVASNPLIEKINLNTTELEKICYVKDGIKIVGPAKEFAFNKQKLDKSFFPMLVGKDMERYLCYWQGLYCCRDEKKIRKHGVTDIRLRAEFIFNRPKLIVRKTGNRIVSAYDENNYYYEQSLFGISLKDEVISYSLFYILGIINSKLANYLLRINPFSKKDTFPQIRLHWLKTLPIKLIRPEEESTAEYISQIILLVKQNIEAKKQLQQAKTEGDKNYLNRKCERLDKEIDQLVYQLYGLTEDEIKIVEKRGD